MTTELPPSDFSLSAKPQPRIVQAVVTGDVTMDWNIARTSSHRSLGLPWKSADSLRIYWQRGGAALLADLIKAVSKTLRDSGKVDSKIAIVDAPKKQIVQPSEKNYPHTYAMWKLFEQKKGESSKEKVWRVEDFMGLDPGAEPLTNSDAGHSVIKDPPEADLVVLDDAALGFRSRTPLSWPQALRAEGAKRPWILLKMSRPVAQGGLWGFLYQRFADRLIVVMTIDDLRREAVHISRGLSWEGTAQSLLQELRRAPTVNALSFCAHVAVLLGPEGAFLLSNPIEAPHTRRAHLFFDPSEIEGTWAQQLPGGIIGATSCLTAALAAQILCNPDTPDWHAGIQRGLAGIRRLYSEGYGRAEAGSPATKTHLAFPLKTVAKEVVNGDQRFTEVPIPEVTSETGTDQMWTILGELHKKGLSSLAEEIVRKGEKVALQDVPIAKFGKLLAVDRQEVEAYRSICSLMEEYCRNLEVKTPLSIAVFGAPGSGKSFGITEIAKALVATEIEKRTFNLSQLNRPEQLLGAFHQVRDLALSGKMPLIFWDEFDTSLGQQPLGWLASFLAPMQDGTFQDGQITHSLGRAIFVFAGGTRERMREFAPSEVSDDFRSAKGPDFVSRLKGYVDIVGPNPRDGDIEADSHYLVRRALLLRSLLLRNAKHLFRGQKDEEMVLDIDSAVLRAFLLTRKYRHGTRSMEAIVAMSSLTGRGRFERSSLPPRGQLALHVDEVDFMERVTGIELEADVLKKLAVAIHQDFCAERRSENLTYGPVTDAALKTHSSLTDFDKLIPEEQDQNIEAARDIPNALASAGYIMVPIREMQASVPPEADSVVVESLAKREHERWLRMKLDGGWSWAPATDKPNKLHKDLVPWDSLSDEERDKIYGKRANRIGSGVLAEEDRKKNRKIIRANLIALRSIGYEVIQA